eukprot:CAMPEP_0196665206 /NCGR_PEP_ID=MMETSP1086-20130531/60006_1 /TAXON_ID=77921 /ORGANISM="Cyanoptyche  gloeocystis , Strain SAG4.97" /LENGTH=187 /DNA_ID=CAMNT_0042001839 /DNA_START=81 /DNA_END=644 /DNA_ORIENTATION=+
MAENMSSEEAKKVVLDLDAERIALLRAVLEKENLQRLEKLEGEKPKSKWDKLKSPKVLLFLSLFWALAISGRNVDLKNQMNAVNQNSEKAKAILTKDLEALRAERDDAVEKLERFKAELRGVIEPIAVKVREKSSQSKVADVLRNEIEEVFRKFEPSVPAESTEASSEADSEDGVSAKDVPSKRIFV